MLRLLCLAACAAALRPPAARAGLWRSGPWRFETWRFDAPSWGFAAPKWFFDKPAGLWRLNAPPPPTKRFGMLRRFVARSRKFCASKRVRRRAVWCLRAFIFCTSAWDGVCSVKADTWTVLRVAPRALTDANAIALRARKQRADVLTRLTGVGYTPRIVALAGLMLRAAHLSARGLPRVFDPNVGFAAGAAAAANYAHREWLVCLLVGWFGGGVFWRVFGVEPPPNFQGVPVVIRDVRVGRGERQA
ncbi:hypothetical protein M885DRAFT_510529 [Pelagophyceae sp. CCMP2097]|nr:hypothetical protein M885DRAFT_510529 [Pelagophyceae sp. CCMP2097]